MSSLRPSHFSISGFPTALDRQLRGQHPFEEPDKIFSSEFVQVAGQRVVDGLAVRHWQTIDGWLNSAWFQQLKLATIGDAAGYLLGRLPLLFLGKKFSVLSGSAALMLGQSLADESVSALFTKSYRVEDKDNNAWGYEFIEGMTARSMMISLSMALSKAGVVLPKPISFLYRAFMLGAGILIGEQITTRLLGSQIQTVQGSSGVALRMIDSVMLMGRAGLYKHRRVRLDAERPLAQFEAKMIDRYQLQPRPDVWTQVNRSFFGSKSGSSGRRGESVKGSIRDRGYKMPDPEGNVDLLYRRPEGLRDEDVDSLSKKIRLESQGSQLSISVRVIERDGDNFGPWLQSLQGFEFGKYIEFRTNGKDAWKDVDDGDHKDTDLDDLDFILTIEEGIDVVTACVMEGTLKRGQGVRLDCSWEHEGQQYEGKVALNKTSVGYSFRFSFDLNSAQQRDEMCRALAQALLTEETADIALTRPNEEIVAELRREPGKGRETPLRAPNKQPARSRSRLTGQRFLTKKEGYRDGTLTIIHAISPEDCDRIIGVLENMPGFAFDPPKNHALEGVLRVPAEGSLDPVSAYVWRGGTDFFGLLAETLKQRKGHLARLTHTFSWQDTREDGKTRSGAFTLFRETAEKYHLIFEFNLRDLIPDDPDGAKSSYPTKDEIAPLISHWKSLLDRLVPLAAMNTQDGSRFAVLADEVIASAGGNKDRILAQARKRLAYFKFQNPERYLDALDYVFRFDQKDLDEGEVVLDAPKMRDGITLLLLLGIAQSKWKQFNKLALPYYKANEGIERAKTGDFGYYLQYDDGPVVRLPGFEKAMTMDQAKTVLMPMSGDGSEVRALVKAHNHLKVQALELSPKALIQAARGLKADGASREKVHLTHFDVLKAPTPMASDTVDRVVINRWSTANFLPHDLDAFFGEMVRVLKPGGRLWYDFHSYYRSDDRNAFFVRQPLDSLRKAAQEQGYQLHAVHSDLVLGHFAYELKPATAKSNGNSAGADDAEFQKWLADKDLLRTRGRDRELLYQCYPFFNARDLRELRRVVRFLKEEDLEIDLSHNINEMRQDGYGKGHNNVGVYRACLKEAPDKKLVVKFVRGEEWKVLEEIKYFAAISEAGVGPRFEGAFWHPERLAYGIVMEELEGGLNLRDLPNFPKYYEEARSRMNAKALASLKNILGFLGLFRVEAESLDAMVLPDGEVRLIDPFDLRFFVEAQNRARLEAGFGVNPVVANLMEVGVIGPNVLPRNQLAYAYTSIVAQRDHPKWFVKNLRARGYNLPEWDSAYKDLFQEDAVGCARLIRAAMAVKGAIDDHKGSASQNYAAYLPQKFLEELPQLQLTDPDFKLGEPVVRTHRRNFDFTLLIPVLRSGEHIGRFELLYSPDTHNPEKRTVRIERAMIEEDSYGFEIEHALIRLHASDPDVTSVEMVFGNHDRFVAKDLDGFLLDKSSLKQVQAGLDKLVKRSDRKLAPQGIEDRDLSPKQVCELVDWGTPLPRALSDIQKAYKGSGLSHAQVLERTRYPGEVALMMAQEGDLDIFSASASSYPLYSARLDLNDTNRYRSYLESLVAIWEAKKAEGIARADQVMTKIKEEIAKR